MSAVLPKLLFAKGTHECFSKLKIPFLHVLKCMLFSALGLLVISPLVSVREITCILLLVLM